jgi:hypothetical protein
MNLYLQKILKREKIANDGIAEFRFVKNCQENDVLDVLSLDVGIG